MAGKAKQKTHKGAAKRMRLTAKGKIRRMKAGRGHLLSHKSAKRKRNLRKDGFVDAGIGRTYREMLGG